MGNIKTLINAAKEINQVMENYGLDFRLHVNPYNQVTSIHLLDKNGLEVSYEWALRPKIGAAFKDFLSKFRREDFALGDLARDVERDASFPVHAESKEEILNYLYSEGACDGAIETFHKAFQLFEYKGGF